MSKFSIDSVETLDYDFTGVPSNSGSGNCKGKGTIPEPSQDRLEAYAKGMRELYNVEKNVDVAAAMDREPKAETRDPEEQAAEAKAKSDAHRELLAELCQNTPSKEELEELPPRIQKAFLKYVHQELADPKV